MYGGARAKGCMPGIIGLTIIRNDPTSPSVSNSSASARVIKPEYNLGFTMFDHVTNLVRKKLNLASV